MREADFADRQKGKNAVRSAAAVSSRRGILFYSPQAN